MSSKVERKLAAIMFTDIVGFTSIMRKDESTGISILENQESLIKPLLSKHKGNLVKRTGDGYLLEFSSSVEAVECAMAMQDSIKEYNTNNNKLEFHIRIGIHLGDVVVLGDDILGDGVNIASRIEPLAKPDGICLTEVVYASVKSKLSINPKRIDEVELKHIDEKYTIYKLPDTEEKSDLDSMDVSSIEDNHPKIRISSFEVLSKVHTEIVRAISKGLLLGLTLHPFFGSIDIIINLFNLLIRGDATFFQNFRFFPASLTGDGWSLFLSIGNSGLDGFLVFLAALSLFYGIGMRKKEEKFVFSDIRNIDKLLDEIVTGHVSYVGGHYEIIEKNKNSISYFPYSSIMKIEKLLYKIVPVMVKLQSFTLRFDGNVITIRGMWFSINKFKKQLNLLEKVIENS